MRVMCQSGAPQSTIWNTYRRSASLCLDTSKMFLICSKRSGTGAFFKFGGPPWSNPSTCRRGSAFQASNSEHIFERAWAWILMTAASSSNSILARSGNGALHLQGGGDGTWGGGGFTGGGGGSTGGGGASGSWGGPAKPQTGRSGPQGIAGPDQQLAPVVQRVPASVTSPAGTTVTRNGYTYEIDGEGRTTQVSGTLTLNPDQRDRARRRRPLVARTGCRRTMAVIMSLRASTAPRTASTISRRMPISTAAAIACWKANGRRTSSRATRCGCRSCRDMSARRSGRAR